MQRLCLSTEVHMDSSSRTVMSSSFLLLQLVSNSEPLATQRGWPLMPVQLKHAGLQHKQRQISWLT